MLMAAKPGFPEILSFGLNGYGDELLWGALMTINIALFAYGLGVIIGVIGAVCKLHGSWLTRAILEGYTTLVRAVPELILILLLYYAGTTALNAALEQFGYGRFAINGFLAAVAVLGFVQGAYHTEVLRAAIRAIPVGQSEAARAFGMTPLLEFNRITFPLMMQNAVPGLANLWLDVTKNSALIAVVGYTELALATRQAAGNTKLYLLFFLTSALIYLLISLTSQKIFDWIERRVRVGQRALT